MKRKAKKILVLAIGSIFIIFGLLGLFLPFLQGILFLIIGLFIISFCFPKVRLWINEHPKKYPRIFPIIEKVEKWMAKIIGEI